MSNLSDTPTPRTDAELVGKNWPGISGAIVFARELERELSATISSVALIRETVAAQYADKLSAAREREARLREALERIVDFNGWGYDGDCGVDDIASAALAETSCAPSL